MKPLLMAYRKHSRVILVVISGLALSAGLFAVWVGGGHFQTQLGQFLLGTNKQQGFVQTQNLDPLLKRRFLQGETLASMMKSYKEGKPKGLFARGQIIVKFKDAPADTVGKKFLPGTKSIGPQTSIASIDNLNNKYKAKIIKPVFNGLREKASRENKSFEQVSSDIRAKYSTRSTRGSKDSKMVNLLNMYELDFEDPDANVLKIVEEYKKDRNVDYAEPNYLAEAFIVPNDPFYSSAGSWGQSYDDLWGLKKIHAEDAWNITTGQQNPVTIAVVDTGVDYNHPDLAANIWTNSAEIPNNGVDDDGNGYIDDRRGWDISSNDNDPMDGYGHGTHVAGTVNALGNNGLGIAGVSWGAKIMAVRVLDANGQGTFDQVAAGIYYAAQNGADVINLSLGGGSDSATLKAAVDYAVNLGVVVVVAAGNDFGGDALSIFPAAYPNVITVAASDHNDIRADFSNRGAKIDVAAPGGDSVYLLNGQYDQGVGSNILSLRASGASPDLPTVGISYARLRGTSMATPHVAGAAALALALHPDWGVETVRHALRQGTDDIMSSGWDPDSGYGRLNLLKLLTQQNVCIPRITSPAPGSVAQDTVTVTGSSKCASGSVSWQLSRGFGPTPTNFTPIVSGQGAGTQSFSQSITANDAPPLEVITLLLTATNEQGQIYSDRVIILPSLFKTGWNKTWHPGTGSTSYGGSPAFVPIDSTFKALAFGDQADVGLNDLHFAGPNEATDRPGWPVAKESSFYATTAVGDLDKNIPGNEMVYPTDSNLLHIYTATGQEITTGGWPRSMQFDPGEYLFTATITDLNADGVNEVLYADKSGVYAYQLDGTQVFAKTVPLISFVSAVAAQLDADPEQEILVELANFNIAAFNLDGSEVPGTPFVLNIPPGSYGGATIVAANIEGDKRDEVFIYYDTFSYPHPPGAVTKIGLALFRSDGTLVPGVWPRTLVDGTWSPPFSAFGDVDGDGTLEIVVSEAFWLHVLDVHGNELPGWPQPVTYSLQTPLLADIDGDNKQEIFLLSTFQKYLLYGFRGNGTALSAFPLNLPNTWVYNMSPVIADIESNNHLDLTVIGALDAVMTTIEFPFTTNTKPQWPTLMQNIGRTGSMSTDISSNLDYDGDGFSNAVETYLGTNPFRACASTDPGGKPSSTWPADLKTGGTLQFNKITLTDLASFIAPVRRLNTKTGDVNFDKRWDLNADGQINLVDMSIITSGSNGSPAYPPMFGGQRAYNGPACMP